jgi:predicted nucleic acid-binding protein
VGLEAELGAGRVAVDTAIFIYYIEEHPDYLSLIAPIFEQTARGERELVTSAVTLLEVLVIPYRARDLALAERYEALLTRSRGLHLVDLNRDVIRVAAQLRAAYPIRTPDALQLAAALAQRCSAFVTNDRQLPRLPGLKVVQLRDQLPSARAERR